MYSKLFAESGLSLDRLKALLEVGTAGSIVKAVSGDPVRQSQYSRQIKELENFFRSRLIERQGKGSRLTANGKELARISRFFMLGLSNFQRGCLAEAQTFRIGASATFIRRFLLPVLSGTFSQKAGASYATEVASDEEIERRLHELTLDFGVVANAALSRPLQTRTFCESFLEASTAMEGERVAALLPRFLAPGKSSRSFVRVHIPKIDSQVFHFHVAWNPRLLRLNPHATRRRDWLADALIRRMAG